MKSLQAILKGRVRSGCLLSICCKFAKSGWRYSTALIPILIPAEGQPGDLILLPNTRPFRKTYLRNLFDKMMLDNPFTQKLLRKRWERGSKEIVKIKMVPGNLYFFWGYRSIHTNEAIDPHNIRATALLHFGNHHESSKLRTMIGR